MSVIPEPQYLIDTREKMSNIKKVGNIKFGRNAKGIYYMKVYFTNKNIINSLNKELLEIEAKNYYKLVNRVHKNIFG